jgi:hypothetical protein
MPEPTDEELALAYLEGQWKRIQGREVFRHIRPKSAEEIRARKALAGLLRQPTKVRPSILHWLSTLIDPAPSPFQTRQFQIVARGRGVPPNLGRDIGIARFVAERPEGEKIKSAVSRSAQRYGVSLAQAYRAWKKHRRRFERRTVILK